MQAVGVKIDLVEGEAIPLIHESRMGNLGLQAKQT